MKDTHKHKKTLKELEGIISTPKIHQSSIEKLKQKRSRKTDTKTLITGIKKGDINFLSKAITLIESTHKKHQNQAQEIIKACLPVSGKSIRIGITGVPGVGKSTFIESYGTYVAQLGHKIAILAIDPSSSIHKGSILGDKTRMETLVRNPQVYIRPSASGDTLGGVSKKTRESIVLCEAAGYDIILIETVGVGQSETAVHSMVDFFLLLKLAGAGDELQGIKRGIIEMADAIVINKADGAMKKTAEIAKNAFQNALHLYPPKENEWIPKVQTCSALEQTGIAAIWQVIEEYVVLTKSNASFEKKRKEQEIFWLYDTIESQLKTRFYSDPMVQKTLEEQLPLLAQKKTTPYEVASILLRIKTH